MADGTAGDDEDEEAYVRALYKARRRRKLVFDVEQLSKVEDDQAQQHYLDNNNSDIKRAFLYYIGHGRQVCDNFDTIS